MPPKHHFLTLPRELRDEIWNDLIPRREIQITHLNTKGPQRKSPSPPGPILNLILTCRQMHDEILDTLYSKTVFRFNSIQDLLWLNPPTQFNVEFIRSIKLFVNVKTHSNDKFFRDWTKDTLQNAARYFTGLWKLQIVLLFEPSVCYDFGEEDWHGHGSGRKVGFKNVFLPIKDIQTLSVVNVRVALEDHFLRTPKEDDDVDATAAVHPMVLADEKLQGFGPWVEKDLMEMLVPPKENFPVMTVKKKQTSSESDAMEVDDESGQG